VPRDRDARSDRGARLDRDIVPKTIDNDIVETTNTFGFNTAVSFATDAIDRLHVSAEAPGRSAGRRRSSRRRRGRRSRVGRTRTFPPDFDVLRTARAMEISPGD
jgi:hypothetical protein